MRMSTNEYIRQIFLYLVSNRQTISSQRSPNVGHPNIDAIALKPLMQGKLLSDNRAVDIAVHADQGRNFSKFISHVYRPKVTGMPYFIAIRKVLGHLWIEIAVCIRN